MTERKINKDKLYSVVFGSGIKENFVLIVFGRSFEFKMRVGNFTDFMKMFSRDLLCDSIVSINGFEYSKEELGDLLRRLPASIVEYLCSFYQEVESIYWDYLLYFRNNVDDVLKDPKFESTFKIFRSLGFTHPSNPDFQSIINNPISYSYFINAIRGEEIEIFETKKAFVDRICSFANPDMMKELRLAEEGKEAVERIKSMAPLMGPPAGKDKEVARLAREFLRRKGGVEEEDPRLDKLEEGGVKD